MSELATENAVAKAPDGMRSTPPGARTGRLRRTVLNIHTYGGLLCFSYLILFGLSSLNFNHPFAFTRARAAPETWQQPIDLPVLPRTTPEMTGADRVGAKAAANNRVRQALGLFGHQRPWAESWWDAKDPNHYHASLVRPGREYEVDVHLDRKVADVKATRTGPWVVMRGLHGLHEKMPDSPLVSTWTWYTELCTGFVLLAGATGLYLWTRRRNERRIGLAMISAAGVLSLGLILYVTLHG